MNFHQWCNQISKELGTRVHREDVYEVMYMAFRVAMEEFAASPDNAELFIHGVGRFYINIEKHRNRLGEEFGQDSFVFIRMIRFTPSRRLKDIVRGKYRLVDMTFGARYLFPEYHLDENGRLINLDGRINNEKEERKDHETV